MNLYDVIKKPVITEKSMLDLETENIHLKLIHVLTNCSSSKLSKLLLMV